MKKPIKKKLGFTLIELLVVIAIIAILTEIIVTIFQDARAKAKNATNKSLVIATDYSVQSFKVNHNDLALAPAFSDATVVSSNGLYFYQLSASPPYPPNGNPLSILFNGVYGYIISASGTSLTTNVYYYAPDCTTAALTDPNNIYYGLSNSGNYTLAVQLFPVRGSTDAYFWAANGSTGSGSAKAPSIPGGDPASNSVPLPAPGSLVSDISACHAPFWQ